METAEQAPVEQPRLRDYANLTIGAILVELAPSIPSETPGPEDEFASAAMALGGLFLIYRGGKNLIKALRNA